MIKQRHLHYLMQDLSNRKNSAVYPGGIKKPPITPRTHRWADLPRPRKQFADIRAEDDPFDKAG